MFYQQGIWIYLTVTSNFCILIRKNHSETNMMAVACCIWVLINSLPWQYEIMVLFIHWENKVLESTECNWQERKKSVILYLVKVSKL